MPALPEEQNSSCSGSGGSKIWGEGAYLTPSRRAAPFAQRGSSLSCSASWLASRDMAASSIAAEAVQSRMREPKTAVLGSPQESPCSAPPVTAPSPQHGFHGPEAALQQSSVGGHRLASCYAQPLQASALPRHTRSLVCPIVILFAPRQSPITPPHPHPTHRTQNPSPSRSRATPAARQSPARTS